MKRFSTYMDRHPLLAILLGYLLLIAIVLIVVPADPPSVSAVAHGERAT